MDSTALKERIYARTTPSPGAVNPGDGTYARVYIGQEGETRRERERDREIER